MAALDAVEAGSVVEAAAGSVEEAGRCCPWDSRQQTLRRFRKSRQRCIQCAIFKIESTDSPVLTSVFCCVCFHTFDSLGALRVQPRESLPTLADPTPVEIEIATLQMGYIERMRRSAYYIVEEKKSSELHRYSDKYKTEARRPQLRKDDLNQEFFPPTVFGAYFDKTKKTKERKKRRKTLGGEDDGAEKLTLDQIMDLKDDEAGSEASEAGSQRGSNEGSVVEDYEEDSDDNDYADNYFDNGEEDNEDGLGGPRAGGGHRGPGSPGY